MTLRQRTFPCGYVACALLVASLAGGCSRGDPSPDTPILSVRPTSSDAPPPDVTASRGQAAATPLPRRSAAPTAATELPPGLEVSRLTGLELDGVPQDGVLVRVDLARMLVEPRAVPGRDLAALGDDPSLLLAVNAGYFEANGAPTGLLAREDVAYGVAGRRGGTGVLVVRERRATLVPFTAAFELRGPAELAVQAGPRLVEADGRPGIRTDDGQRAPRTVLCLGEGGRRIDLVLVWRASNPLEGPGLFALSRALSKPLLAPDPRRCEQALNLDGGPSTGLVLRRDLRARDAVRHLPLGPVPWALAVRPRPTGAPGP